jgi:hypothetical protein
MVETAEMLLITIELIAIVKVGDISILVVRRPEVKGIFRVSEVMPGTTTGATVVT